MTTQKTFWTVLWILFVSMVFSVRGDEVKVLAWFGKSQTGKSSSIKLLTNNDTI